MCDIFIRDRTECFRFYYIFGMTRRWSLFLWLLSCVLENVTGDMIKTSSKVASIIRSMCIPRFRKDVKTNRRRKCRSAVSCRRVRSFARLVYPQPPIMDANAWECQRRAATKWHFTVSRTSICCVEFDKRHFTSPQLTGKSTATPQMMCRIR